MYQFFLSGLRQGFRGRSLQAVFCLSLFLVGLAWLAGHFSPRQPQTVTLDVGFSGIRFSLVLLTLFWVQELVAREIDRRTILLSLAYPVPRSAFLLGRFLAVFALLGIAAAIIGLLLGIAVFFTVGGYQQQFPVALDYRYWITIAGFLIDASVVAAFALWIASLSTVSVLPLALGTGFAIGGKALGAAIDYLAKGADGDRKLVEQLGPIIDAVRWVLPDLSRLDWRTWPMYGPSPGWDVVGWSVAMGLGYLGVMLALAVISLQSREFA